MQSLSNLVHWNAPLRIGQNRYPLHCPLGIWYACRVDTTRHPLAGLDYPRTFQAMDERFRDDEACVNHWNRELKSREQGILVVWAGKIVAPSSRLDAERPKGPPVSPSYPHSSILSLGHSPWRRVLE